MLCCASHRRDLRLRSGLGRHRSRKIILTPYHPINIGSRQSEPDTKCTWAMIEYGCPPHVSSVLLVLETGRPMHRAAIVPLHQVANVLPSDRKLVLGALSVVEKVLQ